MEDLNNIAAELFQKISTYYFELKDFSTAKYYFEKTIEFNKQDSKIIPDFDKIFNEFKNKSEFINRNLLAYEIMFLKKQAIKTHKEIELHIIDKYFLLDGMRDIFLNMSGKHFKSEPIYSDVHYESKFEVSKRKLN